MGVHLPNGPIGYDPWPSVKSKSVDPAGFRVLGFAGLPRLVASQARLDGTVVLAGASLSLQNAAGLHLGRINLPAQHLAAGPNASLALLCLCACVCVVGIDHFGGVSVGSFHRGPP